MELLLVFICLFAYFKTLEPLCLVAMALLMIAWEIWFCFHDKKDKKLSEEDK